MVCSRQSIGWGGLWRSCCPSCQIFGAVRFEPKRSFLDSPRERRCSWLCSWLQWHIVVKPRRRKTTRTYCRFWKSRWNNELRCIGFGWLRSPISIYQESEDNIELLPLYHVPCVTLCTLSLLLSNNTHETTKKKKKDCQMSVYHKADPGELIQRVTHESRSSAASNSGLIRIGTQPQPADAWHHDSCRPRGVVTRDFRPFLTVCLTVFPFEFRPRTFTIGFYGKKSFISELMILECSFPLRQGPPWFEFLVIFYFLHHGIEEVERHLLWKFHEKIQRKSWSNAPPKLLVCLRFLWKVVHKIGRLRKFNHAREIKFNFFTAWTIFMKLGTLVHHVHGYKSCLRFFNVCLGTYIWSFKVEKKKTR